MTLEKALEIMRNINVEKATYINNLEYHKQQMKDTDMDAASIKTELRKTRKEMEAIETAIGRLMVYKYAAEQGGKE